MKPEGVSGVLFAAGRGTRLRPLTDSVPKAVFPILDVPLGTFGLKELLESCATVFVNAPTDTAGAIEAGLAPLLAAGGITLVTESPEPFGTAGTLASIKDRVQDTIVTWNADTITDLRARKLVQSHRSSGSSGTIAVVPVEQGADVAYRDQRVTGYIDRRLRLDAGGGRFLGAAVLERSVLDRLPLERPLGLAEAILEPLARAGELAVHEHTGYAIDVGTFPRYLQASMDMLEGRGPEPPREWPGEIRAVHGGAAYVGPGASVAEKTLGAGAIVLAGATVEEGAFVERAIVWTGTSVPGAGLVREKVWF